MLIKKFQKLACPIDLEILKSDGSGYACAHRHCFDMSRVGYVNLLPSQFKNSQNPGDKKEMVEARSDFLNTGSYEGILDSLFAQVISYIQAAKGTHFNIVDAGCGEGYYTAGLAQKMKAFQADFDFSIFGYDISKEAVHAAAKRSKELTWAVATNNRMPVLENSVDIILCLFGFPVFPEFARILKKGGIVILVDAGQDHLLELRQRIYEQVFKKEIEPKSPDGFKCIDTKKQSYFLENLSGQSVSNLLKMTPHFYRMQKEKYEEVIAHPPSKITVDITLTVYEIL